MQAPFDEAALERWLGVPPPSDLAAFLLDLQHLVGAHPVRFEDALDDLVGVRLADAETSTPDLPTDALPIFWSGIGEGSAVYAVSCPAPELDLPTPMLLCIDGRVRSWASSVGHGLTRLLLGRLEEGEEIPAELLHWAQGVLPEPGRDPGVVWPPALPPGVRHVRARDGIGVVAPSRAFDLRALEGDPSLSLDEQERWANHLLNEGYPGSALIVLKDAIHAGRRRADVWRLGRLLAESQLALGRPGLALVARRRSARFG